PCRPPAQSRCGAPPSFPLPPATRRAPPPTRCGPACPCRSVVGCVRRVPQAGRGLSRGHLSGLPSHCPAFHQRLLWIPNPRLAVPHGTNDYDVCPPRSRQASGFFPEDAGGGGPLVSSISGLPG